eukprot:scaffold803_cov310-Pinguiococcus_pyrenoidosus.AAC.89
MEGWRLRHGAGGAEESPQKSKEPALLRGRFRSLGMHIEGAPLVPVGKSFALAGRRGLCVLLSLIAVPLRHHLFVFRRPGEQHSYRAADVREAVEMRRKGLSEQLQDEAIDKMIAVAVRQIVLVSAKLQLEAAKDPLHTRPRAQKVPRMHGACQLAVPGQSFFSRPFLLCLHLLLLAIIGRFDALDTHPRSVASEKTAQRPRDAGSRGLCSKMPASLAKVYSAPAISTPVWKPPRPSAFRNGLSDSNGPT